MFHTVSEVYNISDVQLLVAVKPKSLSQPASALIAFEELTIERKRPGLECHDQLFNALNGDCGFTIILFIM